MFVYDCLDNWEGGRLWALARRTLDSRRLRGDGASSSSLSLQPSPVVNPTPSRRFWPSRWRILRLASAFQTFSPLARRASPLELNLPLRVGAGDSNASVIMVERGESSPARSIMCGNGVLRSKSLPLSSESYCSPKNTSGPAPSTSNPAELAVAPECIPADELEREGTLASEPEREGTPRKDEGGARRPTRRLVVDDEAMEPMLVLRVGRGVVRSK